MIYSFIEYSLDWYSVKKELNVNICKTIPTLKNMLNERSQIQKTTYHIGNSRSVTTWGWGSEERVNWKCA